MAGNGGHGDAAAVTAATVAALEAEVEELRDEVDDARRTSFLELFFDLVFVFGITQVTALVLADTSAAGFGRSALILALMWWAWSGFAWTTTAIDIEGYGNRLGVLAGTAAAFFMAFAIPGGFGDDAEWFALSYFAARAIQIGLMVWGVRDNATYLRSALRIAPFFVLSPSLVVAGGFLGGDAQIVLWVVAVAIDVIGAFSAGGGDFRVSATHFAERHALFVIIVLGESLIAIGIGASEAHRDAALAGTILLAVAGTIVLWWAYFDFTAAAVERALERRSGRDRGHIARDVFTLGHYPVIAGIVLFAVAAKKVVAHAEDPLSSGGRVALAGAIVAFVLGLAAGRLRLIRKLAYERLTAAAVAVVAVIVLDDIPGVALLAIVIGALAVALAVETVRLREARAAIRAGH